MSRDTFSPSRDDAAQGHQNSDRPLSHPHPHVMGMDGNVITTLAKLAEIHANIDPVVMGAPLKYSATELAEVTGTPLALIEAFVSWLGRPPQDPDEVRYTDTDVTAMGQAMEFVTTEGLDEYAMGSMVRSASASLQKLAQRHVEALVQEIAHRENVSDTQARLIAGIVAPAQAERLRPLVDHIWRRQYADAVRILTTEAIMQRGILSGDDGDYPLIRAVGFADLVNFTARTKDMKVRDFSRLIREFSDQSWDIVNSRGGRIVSFIGDAIFFIADDVETGAEIALALAENGRTSNCGAVRVGLVWTRVMKANGDVFGPGVNLASRVTRAAPAGEVYVDEAAATRLKHLPEFTVSEQTPFDARGIGIVQPYKVSYTETNRSM